MQVQVPAGVKPGQAFVVALPNGQQQQVMCPEDSQEGDLLLVSIQETVQGRPVQDQRGGGAPGQNQMMTKPDIGIITICVCVCFFPIGLLAFFCPCDQKTVMVDAQGREIRPGQVGQQQMRR